MAFLRRLFCFLLGHEFFVVQRFSPQSRRVGCHNCDGDWGMNDDARALVRWGPEFEAMYRERGHDIKPRD